MKVIATLLLSVCSLMALAQHKTKQSLHQDIDDDGKTLTINISGTASGKAFSYSQEFNVSGMSKQAKDALINRITDSLGVNRHNNPPLPPTPPASLNVEVTGNNAIHSSIHEHDDTLMISISGTKNDTPLRYKRTFNVKGLSRQDKDAIIRHVTDSLGISGKVR